MDSKSSYICANLTTVTKFTQYGGKFLFGYNKEKNEYVAIQGYSFDGKNTYIGDFIVVSDNPIIAWNSYHGAVGSFMHKKIRTKLKKQKERKERKDNNGN